MKWKALLLLGGIALFACRSFISPQLTPTEHDLYYSDLPRRWDEGIPLGNGWLGALVWQRENQLRLSLDRADLWDLRPMPNLRGPEFRFRWVIEQWRSNRYTLVQQRFDAPYEREPAPTKIPGGALEFPLASLGSVASVRLFIRQATCEVKWENGTRLLVFIDARNPVGWFRFERLRRRLTPEIRPPHYTNSTGICPLEEKGSELHRLGYPPGALRRTNDHLLYVQPGWNGFQYRISVRWRQEDGFLTGCWSISAHFPAKKQSLPAELITEKAMSSGWQQAWRDHTTWWEQFWAASSIDLPDELLERQWFLEMYKFGSVARESAPPISLQAIWTADNGKLPPWKGDFHHDLNTELSYWPAYSSNHVQEGLGLLNWLWENRETFRAYTRTYFEADGLNVPGVTTLSGEPMGGWIQYAFGPTVAAWLGHHFYLHWRFTADRIFLRQRAYPWIRDVATFFEQIAVTGPNGKKQLPLSSSPEYFGNSPRAWFRRTTNFDLALIRWTYRAAAEMADSLDLHTEAARWRAILSQWPGLAVDSTEGLLIAPGQPYDRSHRHLSHLIAIHPLGLLDWSQGPEARNIIRNSLQHLENMGTDWWTGYTYGWLGNLKARAHDGEGAARALRIFAECFCLPNSFHANGDQSGTGKSKLTYRPFTLEGNFAFAAGVQEMLLQSHTGTVEIFPAVPPDWKEVSFHQLRAQGAFLVSAEMKNGRTVRVEILAEKGGILRLVDPFPGRDIAVKGARWSRKNSILSIYSSPGQRVEIIARHRGHPTGK